MKTKRKPKMELGLIVVDRAGRIGEITNLTEDWASLHGSTHVWLGNNRRDSLRFATKKEASAFVYNLDRRPTSVEDVKRGIFRPFHDKISDQPRSVLRYFTNDSRFSRR